MTNEEVKQLADFCENLNSLNRCCLRHGSVQDPQDVARVIKWSGPSSDSTEYGIFQLKTGAFGVLVESSDYTGHGCQCNSDVSIHDTLEDAIRLGLGSDGKEKLGYKQQETS